MTNSNQAFIKAYRQDDPQPSPASPAIANAARAAAPMNTAPLVHAARAVPGERSAIYGPRPDHAARTETKNSTAAPVLRGSPDPAHESVQQNYLPERPSDETVARSGDRPQRAGEKRPLSSFIASTGIARLSTEPADGDFFRPGTMVASFHWPVVCRTLSRQCAQELGKVADQLITHANAGRSLVGVVGLKRFEGATTTALCIAQRLAERRRRTILVDANFRQPALANLLEAEPTAGWQDVLVRGSPLTDAAIRATDDRLDLLALGGRMPNDVARAVSGLQAVVTAGVLRHAYEHVIFDLGAFLDAASQPIVLELVRNMGIDAVVAVTRPGGAATRDIGRLADQLARSGCEFLGIIENLCR